MDNSSQSETRITRLKSLLDLVVGGVSVLYALGYGAWAAYALDRQIGVQPILESQYLIAGILPALILAVLYGVLWLLRRLLERFRKEPTPEEVTIGKYAERIGAIGVFAGLLLNYSHLKALGWTIFSIGTLGVIGSLFLTRARVDRIFAHGFYWLLSVSATALGVVAFFSYAIKVFPFIPPELGGPEARCVTLDINAKLVSPATKAFLVDANPSEGPARTKPLWLLLQGTSYLLADPTIEIRGHAFRIRADVVTGVFPNESCGAPAPKSATR
jgi:hypothetical protein